MRKVTIGDLGDIYTGNTPSKKNVEFYDSEDIMFIKPDILDFDINTINESNEYVSERAREKARIIPKDSLLVSCIGNIGKLGINKKEAAFNQQINAIVHNEKIVSSRYLAYLIKYNQKKLEAIANAPVVPIINKTQFSNFELFIHENLETQNKIVEVLDKAQSLIDKKKEQIELLDELVKSRFIEMFGDIRTNKKRWEEEELSNLLINIDSGKSFVCEGYERKGDYPAILKLSAVTYGVYKPLENKALINEEEFIDNMEVKEGDLLFTRKNTPELVGMSAYVYKTTPNLMMPDLIFRLNTNENCNKIYLWKLINNEMFREKIKMISNGSAKSMSNISKQNLMKLKIPVPPIELQNEFAEFVTQTDSIRSKMEASLSELEDNFNSLMQKAFKGELF